MGIYAVWNLYCDNPQCGKECLEAMELICDHPEEVKNVAKEAGWVRRGSTEIPHWVCPVCIEKEKENKDEQIQPELPRKSDP